jgi:hypothetical protein
MVDFMRYSLEKVNTLQACDALLTRAQVKKQVLERKRRNLGESIDTFRGRLDEVSQESVLVQSALVAFTAAYEALLEGRDKASIRVKIKRLEVRMAVLEKKAYTYNVAALLVKEMKYNTLDNQISVLENCITAVEQRKAALGSAALRVIKDAVVSRLPAARQRSQSEGKPFVYPVNLNLNGSLNRDFTTLPREIAGFQGLSSLITRTASSSQPPPMPLSIFTSST